MAQANLVKCYHSHPAYPVTDEYVIYGGNCSRPIVEDGDVYVALDTGWMPTQMSWPWVPGESFLFTIDNYKAPRDPKSFQALIEYLAVQLTAGKKVHVGCIGGHGRTGIVFAALRKHMANDENAIAHAREHYCKKAVETKEQLEWLHKHWGISIEGVAAIYKGFEKSTATTAKSAQEFFVDDDGKGGHLDVRGGKKRKPRVEGCTRSEGLGCWNDAMCKNGLCTFLVKGEKGTATVDPEPLTALHGDGEPKKPRAEIRMATPDEIEAAKKPLGDGTAISWNSKTIRSGD